MKKSTLLPLIWLAMLAGAFAAAPKTAAVEVDPAHSVIVTPAKTNALIDYAVQELQKHVKLISGVELPVATKASAKQFPIYVGSRPADDTEEFATEEARWRVTAKGIWLYGKDRFGSKKAIRGGTLQVATSKENQAGTLFAVYEFLETNLGVRWVEPGDAGITYVPAKVFQLAVARGGWAPQLVQRHMRAAYKDSMISRAVSDCNIPPALLLSDAEIEQRRTEEVVWQRRMRMGGDINFTYGHAFTKWWDEYGESHPEYFAMDKNGHRGPSSPKAADRVKMCVSNPDLIKQIVADHFARKGGLVINACENDSRGFCNCENCKALDVRLPGEENLDVDDLVLTDRYVHFANAVLREARKYNPQAKTVFYAYSRYNYPPRREKLDDGVILFLLPNLAMTKEETETYYQQWKDANAKEVYLRPNDLCQDTGLPHGFEQHMFMKLKTAQDYLELRGTDYDTCWGFWPITGIADYIMARGFYRPERSFEDWNSEYCQTFGAAAPEMTAYYQYWRQIWNHRVMPNLDRITALENNIKLLRAKLSEASDLLYSEADFDATDALLQKALGRELTDGQRSRIQTLVIANEHSRLKYRAMAANRLGTDAPLEVQRATSQALYDFRRAHRNELNINWDLMVYLENAYYDCAGTERLLGTESDRLHKYRLSFEDGVKEARAANDGKLY